jgi:hypothetical protein
MKRCNHFSLHADLTTTKQKHVADAEEYRDLQQLNAGTKLATLFGNLAITDRVRQAKLRPLIRACAGILSDGVKRIGMWLWYVGWPIDIVAHILDQYCRINLYAPQVIPHELPVIRDSDSDFDADADSDSDSGSYSNVDSDSDLDSDSDSDVDPDSDSDVPAVLDESPLVIHDSDSGSDSDSDSDFDLSAPLL